MASYWSWEPDPAFDQPGTLRCVFSLHDVWSFQPSLWCTWHPVSWLPPSLPGPLLLLCSLHSVPRSWQASSFCRLFESGVFCLWTTFSLFLLANSLSFYLHSRQGLTWPRLSSDSPWSPDSSFSTSGWDYRLVLQCFIHVQPGTECLNSVCSHLIQFFDSPLNCSSSGHCGHPLGTAGAPDTCTAPWHLPSENLLLK